MRLAFIRSPLQLCQSQFELQYTIAVRFFHRLQSLADRLSEKYGINAKWVSDREAEVKRTGVSGKITCHDAKVTVFLDLSFMLNPLKERIENRVRRELETCLA